MLTDIRDSFDRLLAFVRCKSEADWEAYLKEIRLSRFAMCEGRFEAGECVKDTSLDMCAKVSVSLLRARDSDSS